MYILRHLSNNKKWFLYLKHIHIESFQHNILRAMLIAALLTISIRPAKAQLCGENIMGDIGLQAGTQLPPSLVVFVPNYIYKASSLRNGDGDAIAKNLDLGMYLTGIGANVVFKKKILKAHWGMSFLIPFSGNRIESTVSTNSTKVGLTDMYFQPIQAGWNIKRADFLFGYSIYFPTGKFELGGDNNRGMGMYTNEFSFGTTVYFDTARTWHTSALVAYDIHTKKKDTDVKTGNIMSIKGGVGKTLYKKFEKNPMPMIFNVGMVYGMQFKTTQDQVLSLDLKKHQVFAMGLEGNIYIPFSNTSIGFRWEDEFGVRNHFRGSNFFITISQFLK